MTTLPITEDDIQVCAGAAFEIRQDYSGRFMYGESCFGIVADQIHHATTAIVLALADAGYSGEDLHAVVDAARTDDMGLQSIVYFPGYKLKEA